MQLICTAKSNAASLAVFKSGPVIDIGVSGPASGSGGQPFGLCFEHFRLAEAASLQATSDA